MARRVAIAGLLLVTAACATPPAVRLPEAPPTAEVVLDEFSISAPEELGSGRVIFRVTNGGTLRHEVIVIEVPADVVSLEEELRSEEGRATTTLSVIPPQEPGDGTVFALDLAPGRYGLLCFLRGGEGREPHALRGMNAEFVVR